MPAPFTKRAIMEAFLTLVAKKALSKITVKDIVDECGINRNTFYYHFQDIYSLVDEYFWSYAEGMAKDIGEGCTWTEALSGAAESMLSQKQVLLNIYKGIGKEKLEEYFKTASANFVPKILQKDPRYAKLDPQDISLITSFYSYAACGLFSDWLNGGMKTDPTAMINRVCQIFEPTIRVAIERAESSKTGEDNGQTKSFV